MEALERDLLAIDSVRYVAVLRDGALSTQSKPGREGASAAESDKYEELIVNPTLLTLTGQRGAIDCGGVHHVVIRYGNFFQVVVPCGWGHVSACVESDGDPQAIARRIRTRLESETEESQVAS